MTPYLRTLGILCLLILAISIAAAQPAGKEPAQPGAKDAAQPSAKDTAQPAAKESAQPAAKNALTAAKDTAQPKTVTQPAPKETAQEGVPAEHHPWGRFPIGSWKLTRATIENLDPLGNVTGTIINETRATLIAADASTYTLKYEVTAEVSGKRFINQPQTTVKGYSGNPLGEKVAGKKTGDAEVEVNGRKIPCQVRQISYDGIGARYVGTVCFSPSVSPYVLRKEETLTPLGEGSKITTSVEVIALGPCRVLADRRNAAFIRKIEKKGDRTITTLETTCDDIPGGEVAHSSQEQNTENKTLRRTTLELLDYSIGNERPDENWGGRRRVLHRSRRNRSDDMQPSPRR